MRESDVNSGIRGHPATSPLAVAPLAAHPDGAARGRGSATPRQPDANAANRRGTQLTSVTAKYVVQAHAVSPTPCTKQELLSQQSSNFERRHCIMIVGRRVQGVTHQLELKTSRNNGQP